MRRFPVEREGVGVDHYCESGGYLWHLVVGMQSEHSESFDFTIKYIALEHRGCDVYLGAAFFSVQ